VIKTPPRIKNPPKASSVGRALFANRTVRH